MMYSYLNFQMKAFSNQYNFAKIKFQLVSQDINGLTSQITFDF